jgi:hypothetical protein
VPIPVDVLSDVKTRLVVSVDPLLVENTNLEFKLPAETAPVSTTMRIPPASATFPEELVTALYLMLPIVSPATTAVLAALDPLARVIVILSLAADEL